MVAPGVIEYDVVALGLCAGVSGARYTTTTEVYPDSPRATPEQCNLAQAVAVRAALDFALAQHVTRIDAGARMSEACIHAGVVHLAGQVPETAGADIEVQTRGVLEAIDALLLQAGTDRTRILRAQVYLADIADFDGMNVRGTRGWSGPRPRGPPSKPPGRPGWTSRRGDAAAEAAPAPGPGPVGTGAQPRRGAPAPDRFRSSSAGSGLVVAVFSRRNPDQPRQQRIHVDVSMGRSPRRAGKPVPRQ